MPQARETLDDRYTTGVWYDIEGQEYCRIAEAENTGRVVLLTPDARDIYFEYADEPFDPDDFIKVDEEAVEDPVGYLERLIDLLLNSQAPMTWEEEIGTRYAMRQTNIVEK